MMQKTLSPLVDPKVQYLRDVDEMLAAIEIEVDGLKRHILDLVNVLERGRRLMNQGDVKGLEEIVAEMDQYLRRLGR